MKKTMFMLGLVSAQLAWSADLQSAAGYWQTISEHSGRPTGVVQIYAVGGELRGKVLEVVPDPGGNADPVCDRCDGAFKNRRIIGMEFLWGMQPAHGAWRNGRILDPDNGSIYRASMELTDGGSRLKVRGYVGIPLLGRSQIWRRLPR